MGADVGLFANFGRVRRGASHGILAIDHCDCKRFQALGWDEPGSFGEPAAPSSQRFLSNLVCELQETLPIHWPSLRVQSRHELQGPFVCSYDPLLPVQEPSVIGPEHLIQAPFLSNRVIARPDGFVSLLLSVAWYFRLPTASRSSQPRLYQIYFGSLLARTPHRHSGAAPAVHPECQPPGKIRTA